MTTERTIEPSARAEIERRLNMVEQTHQVTVLYACESGSRAWGFASTDSDYDVRFLYLRPPEWYLSVDLEEKRDVIEQPIEGLWDINGWDLRKALRLFRKSNPPLLEWLQSPIIYRTRSSASEKMNRLLPTHYSPSACIYHYLHMAQGNYRGYLRSETVRTKKYFYVLRPLLGCRWIEQDLGVVPMEFEKLVTGTKLPEEVEHEIFLLIESKRTDVEATEGPVNPLLSGFIESEFSRHRNSGITREKPRTDVEQLTRIFQETLGEIYGGTSFG